MADATVAMVDVVETSLGKGSGGDERVVGVVTIFPLELRRERLELESVSYSTTCGHLLDATCPLQHQNTLCNSFKLLVTPSHIFNQNGMRCILRFCAQILINNSSTA